MDKNITLHQLFVYAFYVYSLYHPSCYGRSYRPSRSPMLHQNAYHKEGISVWGKANEPGVVPEFVRKVLPPCAYRGYLAVPVFPAISAIGEFAIMPVPDLTTSLIASLARAKCSRGAFITL
jgi:hypothetical protein